MGEKKVTMIVLKVDLQCCKCYKKVKRILCKIPQIQDQIYNEKENTVTIKVVCCSPEKIMQKIRCKGGDSIQSIEILPPPKPKEPEEKKKPEEKEKPPEKKEKPPEKKEKPPETSKGTGPRKPPVVPQPPPPPTETSTLMPLIHRIPATGYPPAYPCSRDCAEGRGGGPCYGGPPRVTCYDGYYGRPVYGCGGGCDRGYYRSRCTDYICEENPNAPCTIM